MRETVAHLRVLVLGDVNRVGHKALRVEEVRAVLDGVMHAHATLAGLQAVAARLAPLVRSVLVLDDEHLLLVLRPVQLAVVLIGDVLCLKLHGRARRVAPGVLDVDGHELVLREGVVDTADVGIELEGEDVVVHRARKGIVDVVAVLLTDLAGPCRRCLVSVAST